MIVTIKIKNQTWKIEEIDNHEFNDVDSDATLYFGQSNAMKQTIYINKNSSDEQKRQTLIHELTHAFMHVYGFGSITEQIPVEIMCDFIGCYGDEIISIANMYCLETGLKKIK